MSATLTADIHSFDDALRFLDGLDVSVQKLGLERIYRLLSILGNPQDAIPAVHVAGTNGKGSVVAMLGSILKAAGYKTGSFISPHLVHVRERVSVGGNPILPDDFQRRTALLKALLEENTVPKEDWPTYFEFVSALAFQHFKDQGTDLNLVEVGLGGRLDATNALNHPAVSVITGIGLDHMQHLGPDLAAIAREKAGILKPGTPLVVGPNVPAEALSAIQAVAAEKGVPVTVADVSAYGILPASDPEDGLVIDAAGTTYRLGLTGLYERENLATTLAVVDALRRQGFDIAEAAVAAGLKQAHWPARFQYVKPRRILLDGSHNLPGFEALAESLSFYFADRPLYWLVSLRNNRESTALLDTIRGFKNSRGVIFTRGERTAVFHDPRALAGASREALSGVCPVSVADDAVSGLSRLEAFLRDDKQGVGVVTGSLYTAGELLPRF